MKTAKILTAGLLAFAGASFAPAQTTIRITGSTAYRKAVHAAIVNILTSPKVTYTNGASGTDGGLGGASRAVFAGTFGGQPVVFETCWAGSVGGVHAVAGSLYSTTSAPVSDPNDANAKQAWVSPTNTTSNGVTTVNGSYAFTGAVYNATPTYENAAKPDVSMSDSFQVSTLYTSPNLTDTKVGVVPFVWCKGASADIPSGSYNALTNITPLMARALLGNGFLPMSMVTGTASDSAYDVIVSGRDNDSGTRLGAFAESGYGIFLNPVHFQLNSSDSSHITSITYFAGTGGYSSGGNLANALKLPVITGARDNETSTSSPVNGSTALPYVPVSYLGTSDAATVTGALGSSSQLMYNGVAYSPAAVQEGQYTFWTYEHLLYNGSTIGTTGTPSVKSLADALAAQIKNTDAVATGILLSTMHVSRVIEGGTVNTTLY